MLKFRNRRLLVQRLENRVQPATLQQSIFPDPTGPQNYARFGGSIAMSDEYRVVGSSDADVAGVGDVGMAFVYDSAGTLLHTLNNPTPEVSDWFGASVAVSGSYVVVGSHRNAIGTIRAGSAHVYDLNSATPTVPVLTLNNPSPATSDEFGISVAISGSTIVVGADRDFVGKSACGTAYVYDLASKTPTVPTIQLQNPKASSNDLFGYSVSISDRTVVVGAYQEDTVGGPADTGIAYVFDLDAGNPTLPLFELRPTNPNATEAFGKAVAVSNSIVVVGSLNDDVSATNAGAAYVFDLKSAVVTTPVVVLRHPTPAANDQFGGAVAVSGQFVVVGNKSDDTSDIDVGSAFVFDLKSAIPTVPLHSLEYPTPNVGGGFGSSVAITGKSVLVAAFQADLGAIRSGNVFTYDLSMPVPSTPTSSLENTTSSITDVFGRAVAISDRFLVVSADGDDGTVVNDGAVFVYDLTKANSSPTFVLRNPTSAAGSHFGYEVAVSGRYVVVGDRLEDTSGPNAGAVFVYDLESANPLVPIQTITNPTPNEGDYFGAFFAISGATLVVGAMGDDVSAMNAGVAYVYDLNSANPSNPVLTIHNPTPQVGDIFGGAIDLAGSWLVVAGVSDHAVGSTLVAGPGTAWVYDLSSKTPDTPIHTINNPTPQSGDSFGSSVSMAWPYLLVTAPGDSGEMSNEGSAYIYDLSTLNPTIPKFTFNNPFPAGGDSFGSEGAMIGTVIAVSALNDDTDATDAGSIFLYDVALPNPTVPLGIAKNPTPMTGDHFGESIAMYGSTLVVGHASDDEQNTNQGSVRVYSLVPTLSSPVLVNDGSLQRSMVNSLTIDFDSRMNSAGDPAAAFSLVNQKTQAAVHLAAAVSPTGNSVTLTFVGGAIDLSGSLADGRYVLTIKANQFVGLGFDGNGDGVAGDDYLLLGTPTNGLFRLFGDSNGDARIDSADYIAFRFTFNAPAGPAFNAAFDFDGDGKVDSSDFVAFRQRFNTSV